MQRIQNKKFKHPNEDRNGYIGGLNQMFTLTPRQMEKIWLRTCNLLEKECDNDDRAVTTAFLRSHWGKNVADELAANLSCYASGTAVLSLLKEMNWNLFKYQFEHFTNEMNK